MVGIDTNQLGYSVAEEAAASGAGSDLVNELSKFKLKVESDPRLFRQVEQLGRNAGIDVTAFLTPPEGVASDHDHGTMGETINVPSEPVDRADQESSDDLRGDRPGRDPEPITVEQFNALLDDCISMLGEDVTLAQIRQYSESQPTTVQDLLDQYLNEPSEV